MKLSEVRHRRHPRRLVLAGAVMVGLVIGLVLSVAQPSR
jgi:hypothetical protein